MRIVNYTNEVIYGEKGRFLDRISSSPQFLKE